MDCDSDDESFETVNRLQIDLLKQRLQELDSEIGEYKDAIREFVTVFGFVQSTINERFNIEATYSCVYRTSIVLFFCFNEAINNVTINVDSTVYVDNHLKQVAVELPFGVICERFDLFIHLESGKIGVFDKCPIDWFNNLNSELSFDIRRLIGSKREYLIENGCYDFRENLSLLQDLFPEIAFNIDTNILTVICLKVDHFSVVEDWMKAVYRRRLETVKHESCLLRALKQSIGKELEFLEKIPDYKIDYREFRSKLDQLENITDSAFVNLVTSLYSRR